jgi:hypothetical protein
MFFLTKAGFLLDFHPLPGRICCWTFTHNQAGFLLDFHAHDGFCGGEQPRRYSTFAVRSVLGCVCLEVTVHLSFRFEGCVCWTNSLVSQDVIPKPTWRACLTEQTLFQRFVTFVYLALRIA